MAEDRVEELKRILQQNEVSVANAHEALEHHSQSTARLGATLEDNVCEVLRKVIVQAEAIEELDRITNWTWRKIIAIANHKGGVAKNNELRKHSRSLGKKWAVGCCWWM